MPSGAITMKSLLAWSSSGAAAARTLRETCRETSQRPRGDLVSNPLRTRPPRSWASTGSRTLVSEAAEQLQRARRFTGAANPAAAALEMAAGEDQADGFLDAANEAADAAGAVIRQYFRTKIDVLDKGDASPVTAADRGAEQAMSALIRSRFPHHGVYGEEGGLDMPAGGAEYVWVLDPIDGTKSFITGKPLFGTLIALVHEGVPVLGVIDQPVLRERWVGRAGKRSTLNGEPIASRASTVALEDAYLYTTSPHLFRGEKQAAFHRVRDRVKTPLYGCDCYAYGLLAAGHADLVVESGLKPYDFLALVPVVEGAGGVITDWAGRSLRFWPTSEHPSSGDDGGTEVAAAGNAKLHRGLSIGTGVHTAERIYECATEALGQSGDFTAMSLLSLCPMTSYAMCPACFVKGFRWRGSSV